MTKYFIYDPIENKILTDGYKFQDVNNVVGVISVFENSTYSKIATKSLLTQEIKFNMERKDGEKDLLEARVKLLKRCVVKGFEISLKLKPID